MSNKEVVYVLMKESDDDYREVAAVFTGPEAKDRSEEAKRLMSMANEKPGGPDVEPRFFIESRISNPSNEQLGLGAPLAEVATDPFVEAAIASIFVKGHATVPSWLNVEWLRYEVSKRTREDIRSDGQVLRIAAPIRVPLGYDQDADSAGFMETDR